MRTGDRVAIVTFSDYGKIRQPLTDNKELLYSALRGLYGNGGTYYNKAVKVSLDALDTNNDNAKIVIFMSDGVPLDTVSEATLQMIKDSGTVFHSVCYGSRINALEKLSNAGNGILYYAKTSLEFMEIYGKIGSSSFLLGPDSDNDGLPDVLESGGMLCSNGKTYYTDPYNSDTDGDGIPDGQEIKYMGVKKGTTNTHVCKMTVHVLSASFEELGISDSDFINKTNNDGKKYTVKSLKGQHFDPPAGIMASAYPNIFSKRVYTFDGSNNSGYELIALVYANGEYWLQYTSLGAYGIEGYVLCDQAKYDYDDIIRSNNSNTLDVGTNGFSGQYYYPDRKSVGVKWVVPRFTQTYSGKCSVLSLLMMIYSTNQETTDPNVFYKENLPLLWSDSEGALWYNAPFETNRPYLADDEIKSLLRENLKNGYPTIVGASRVQPSYGDRPHYVLVVGYYNDGDDWNDYIVIDPWWSSPVQTSLKDFFDTYCYGIHGNQHKRIIYFDRGE